MATPLIMSSAWIVGLLLDASLKAILLAVLAGGAMWLLRVRSTSVRHRVWTAVLAGMLAMPLLVAWSPTVPLPTWAYPDLRLAESARTTAIDPIAAPNIAVPVADDTPVLEPSAAPPSMTTIPAAATADEPNESVAIEPPARSWSDRVSWLLLVCYTLGCALFGGRLLAGLFAARRLVRNSEPIELPLQHASEIGSIGVLTSSQVRVPLTVGWLRPKILLPNDWSSWSESMLSAVLAHEQAHVRRRDPWVALVAQVNRVIYWFHPLAWFLARRLTSLAESTCDDAVIEALGDRTAYARHLLNVAGRLAGQPRQLQPLGVAMAARPAVEHRIDAILDDRRPLARRVGWLGTLVLLAAITPAVMLAAGITADKGGPEVETDPPVVLASTTGSLLLTVLDDNDAPVPGANVKVRVRQVFMGPDSYVYHQTDDAGRLKFEVPKPTPYYLSAQVTLPGYAPFLAEWENHDTPDPIPAEYTVHLDPGRTIGGIVHDEKGQPIEGASVHPQFNITLREERTYQMGSGVSVKSNAAGEWIYASLPTDVQQLPITFEHPSCVAQRVTEQVSELAIPAGARPSVVTVMKHGIAFGGRVASIDGKPIYGATVKYFQESRFSSDSPTATTDKEGAYRFTCGEVGDVLLTVSAPGLAPAKQTVQVAEEMERVDFQLTRGTPLRVRVVGPDQKPLPNAFVSFWNWDEQGVYGSLADSRGKTDANGVWQWSHAPSGLLQFDVSLPGFRHVRGEPLTPGEDNIIVMTRETAAVIEGRLLKITGRVVDAATKAPIARFRVTAGYQREAGGRTIWLHDSQSKGRSGAYRREFTPNDLGSDMYAIALRVEADGYRPAVVERAIADKHDFKADVALEKAADEGFRVLMPNGEVAAGATVAVCTPVVGPIVQDGIVIPNSTCERTTTDATGRFSIMPQKGLYDLFVLHDSGAAYVTQLKLAESHTILLEPWARVEGTLRMHGQPAANETIRLDRADSPLMNAPKIFYQYNTKTDESGKFSFEQVVPGNGQVARVTVTQFGGGASSSTPTLVSDVTFLPGETSYVELGRVGRQIVGKLLMLADAKPGNDWRLAMISLRSRPHNGPERPKIPFPLGINPLIDRDAAQIWWEQWRFTDEGKQFQKEMKRYQDAFNGFKPVSYTARVEPDGTFTFDDIPGGDYQLNVHANALANHRVSPGQMIARLEHDFAVPDAPAENTNEPFDLGELTLKSFKRPQPTP